jgi:hypothetical protein
MSDPGASELLSAHGSAAQTSSNEEEAPNAQPRYGAFAQQRPNKLSLTQRSSPLAIVHALTDGSRVASSPPLRSKRQNAPEEQWQRQS